MGRKKGAILYLKSGGGGLFYNTRLHIRILPINLTRKVFSLFFFCNKKNCLSCKKFFFKIKIKKTGTKFLQLKQVAYYLRGMKLVWEK